MQATMESRTQAAKQCLATCQGTQKSVHSIDGGFVELFLLLCAQDTKHSLLGATSKSTVLPHRIQRQASFLTVPFNVKQPRYVSQK